MATTPSFDRFNRPRVEQLAASLEKDARRLFDQARSMLRELEGVEETPAWYGDSWHWTIEYPVKERRNEPLALIVPSPTDLQLAVPLDREFTSSLPVRRMTRAVREGLKLAQEPFDTRWAVWSIVSTGQVGDLQDLLERKLQHLQKRVG